MDQLVEEVVQVEQIENITNIHTRTNQDIPVKPETVCSEFPMSLSFFCVMYQLFSVSLLLLGSGYWGQGRKKVGKRSWLHSDKGRVHKKVHRLLEGIEKHV